LGQQDTSTASVPSRVGFAIWLILGFVLVAIGTLFTLLSFPLIIASQTIPHFFPSPDDPLLGILMFSCPLGMIMAVLGVSLVILMSWELLRTHN
jgi:hypothetical protein